MASYKLNIARIKGSVAAKALAKSMEDFGLGDNEEFGVINISGTDSSVFGTLVRRTRQAVPKVDSESKEITSEIVERVTLYPFGVKPSGEILETYAGSAAGFEQVGAFFSGHLALSTVVEARELDIPQAIENLAKNVQRFVLRSVRVSDYSHNSYMSGPYSPKFLDSEHGMEFLEKYAQQVKSASVKFQAPHGRAVVNLTPNACFSYSCDEEDQSAVQSIIRKLV